MGACAFPRSKQGATKNLLLSTGLEPMTLALSEPRATNCAKRAIVRKESQMHHQFVAVRQEAAINPSAGVEAHAGHPK